MSILLKALSVTFGALFALSFAGALWPLGDSLAVFRVPLATLFALCLIWTNWPRRVRWPLAVLAMAAIAQIALPRWAVPELNDHDVTLYQQNLLFSRRHDADWLAELATRRPDIITLQEVSGRNMALLDFLKTDYPTQAVCHFATVGGVAVLSHFPSAEAEPICVEQDGLVAVRLETPQGPLWAASLHLHWPWPYEQAEQVDRLLPTLERLTGPVVLGGDFNAVGWSQSVRRIARSMQAARLPHAGPSFVLPRIAMPVTIDHVLTNTGPSTAISLPRHGSDHFGIFAKVSLHAD